MKRDVRGDYRDGSGVFYISENCLAGDRKMEDSKDLLGTFWEDDTELNVLVLHSFRLLWAFQEWNIENIGLTCAQFAQVFPQICIPSNAEWVGPTSKDRVPGLDFQVGLSFVTTES